MNEKIQKLYDQRMQDYRDTMNIKESKHILVTGGVGSAQIGLYGMTVQECLDDPDKYIEKCTKMYEDFAVDFISGGLLNALEAIWALGRTTYFICEDGIGTQFREDVPMEADEYPQLIEDPMGFMVDTLFPRKFPLLMQNYPQSYEVLKGSARKYLHFAEVSRKYGNYAKEHYGVISTVSAKSYPPFDVIFDRLRGFAGSMKDLRRQAELMSEACDALLPIYMKPLENLNAEVPHAGTTIHCPTFLRTEDFEKYFWPTYKKMILFAYEKGSKTHITGEGNLERFYDLMLDLPKASISLSVEDDDIFKAKKKIGHKICLRGGMPMSYIKYKTKQECLDYAKYLCDELAPGGGYIFGTNVSALAPDDLM